LLFCAYLCKFFKETESH